nr:hypothetical protein [Tanacetum cinerariifolium]
MAASLPVCLMSKATSTMSWLWHQRLSHLNFGTINGLTRLDLVDGLLKFKYRKDHLCFAYERGKSKKASHSPKLVPSDNSKLELLYMDLCGPTRVTSINGKKYILVIVDDYSRYTWVYFLHSKDETPEIIKKFIAQAQLNYKAKVCKIRTDNDTEFKNATLKAHYEKLGIMQQFSTARTPQQNRVVERLNHSYTYNKTPYELLRGQKSNVEYFHVFGSLCYPTNDRDDLGKMKPKVDIGVFIGYSKTSRGFRIYNRRTKKIMETIHVKFDELTAMASEHDFLEPELQRFNNHNSSANPMNIPSKEDLDNLFGLMFKEYFGKKSSDTSINSASQLTQFHEDSPSTSSINVKEHEAPPIEIASDEQTSPISLIEADKFHQEDSADFNGNAQFVPYNPPSYEAVESSSMALEPSNVQNFHQVQPSTHFWTKDHPLDQVIGDPSKPLMTRQRLHTDSEVCRPEGKNIIALKWLWKNKCDAENIVRKFMSANLKDSLIQNSQIMSTGIVDLTLFTRRHGGDILLVQVYVDDIIRSTNPDFLKCFANLIKNNFEMSMMDELKFFLRLQVHQSPRGIFISQSQYAIELLKKYGMDECVSMSTHMATERLDADLQGTPTDQMTYHRMIGELMYLTASRPDIAYATFYPKDSGFELIAYSDADHARCKDDCKSTSGGLQFLEYQLADLFTKALPKERFEYLVHHIVIIMAQQQLVADVHPDDLCPLNKRYDLMDANKKIDLEHVQCPPESKILTNIIKNHLLRLSIATSSSIPWIYMAQFWHTLKEDVPTVDKVDEMTLQDTLQVSLTEHKIRKEQEARENVEVVNEHLASMEIEKMVEGHENIIDDSSISRNDEHNILGTREKGLIIEEFRNTPFPTPIRSPRIYIDLVSLDTEKL